MGNSIHITNTQGVSARADVMLANHFPQYSRAALVKLFDIGKITKDDKVLKPGDKIQPGNSIQADVTELTKPVESIDLPVLYEDDNIIVINKPTGVISHARGRYWDEPSVASFIRDKITGVSGERAGIVHRLDRATSGVMICAKNQQALSQLQKQFSQRKVHKTYIAITEAGIKEEKGMIDVPLARNPRNPKTFRPDAAGKEAKTEFHLLAQTAAYAKLQLHPLTGRTHQLRVHLQYIRHPIIGDELYGGAPADRLYLHAYSLEITIPGGERRTFIAPLPKEFDELL